MYLSAPVPVLKSQAKRLKHEQAIPLSEALNRIARREGFASWSLLVARASAGQSRELFELLAPGDLLLLGARPGHGKTLGALTLLASALRRGLPCWFFSLENDPPNLVALLESLGERSSAGSKALIFDHSDNICAQYIMARAAGSIRAKSVVVIDYLQLLDQRRDSPTLQEQVALLRDFAQRTACIIVFISQIHSSFDSKAQRLPSALDVRLPNPLDLSVFHKHLFLNGADSKLVPQAARRGSE